MHRSVGGHEILADVYRGQGDQIRPVIIWIHGGALISGTRKWVPPGQLRRYLEAGYAVVAIDHRLAPETKLSGILEDIEAAYRWVYQEGKALFRIDPYRIAIVGHSSGGYLTLLAGIRSSPRPRAPVSFDGFGNLTGDWTVKPSASCGQKPAVSRSQALAVVGTVSFLREHL